MTCCRSLLQLKSLLAGDLLLDLLVHEVISGAVNGGLVNQYPRLAEGSEMDAGRGRLIPRQGASRVGD